MNPLDLPGPAFLAFYAALTVAAGVLAGWLRRRALGPAEVPDARASDLDPYEVAWLAGGRTRVVHAVVSRLLHAGHLKADGPRLAQGAPPPDRAHPLELAVWRGADQLTVEEVERLVERNGRESEARLRRLGYLATPAQQRAAGHAPWFVWWPLLLLGLAKVAVGVSRERPVLLLVLLVLAVFILGGVLWQGAPPHLTRLGEGALAQWRARTGTLRTNALADAGALSPRDLTLAVALFGATALAGPALAEARDLLVPKGADGGGGGSSSGGSCSSSTDSSGGSSCGSSCGGCGGGGCS
jgi:uncharacterized protein (TIGR04222 family)